MAPCCGYAAAVGRGAGLGVRMNDCVLLHLAVGNGYAGFVALWVSVPDVREG